MASMAMIPRTDATRTASVAQTPRTQRMRRMRPRLSSSLRAISGGMLLNLLMALLSVSSRQRCALAENPLRGQEPDNENEKRRQAPELELDAVGDALGAASEVGVELQVFGRREDASARGRGDALDVALRRGDVDLLGRMLGGDDDVTGGEVGGEAAAERGGGLRAVEVDRVETGLRGSVDFALVESVRLGLFGRIECGAAVAGVGGSDEEPRLESVDSVVLFVEHAHPRLDRLAGAVAELVGADADVHVAGAELLAGAPAHDLSPEAVVELVAQLRAEAPHGVGRQHQHAALALRRGDDQRVAVLLAAHVLEALERGLGILFDAGGDGFGDGPCF